MKRLFYIFLITPGLFSCSYNNEPNGFTDKVIKEVTNTTKEDINEFARKEVMKVIQESQKIDSSDRKLIKQEVKKLISLILRSDKNKISRLVDFPLNYESSNAFGFNENGSDSFVEIGDIEFKKEYFHFFKTPFLDSLKTNPEDFEIFYFNEKVQFRISINTFEPRTKNREWGIECGHQIGGYLQDSTVRISYFGLLCGGIM